MAFPTHRFYQLSDIFAYTFGYTLAPTTSLLPRRAHHTPHLSSPKVSKIVTEAVILLVSPRAADIRRMWLSETFPGIKRELMPINFIIKCQYYEDWHDTVSPDSPKPQLDKAQNHGTPRKIYCQVSWPGGVMTCNAGLSTTAQALYHDIGSNRLGKQKMQVREEMVKRWRDEMWCVNMDLEYE